MKRSEAKNKHNLFIHASLLYSSFGLFLLGQLGRISLGGQEINVYLYEPVIFLYLIYLFGLYRLEPFKAGIGKTTAFFLTVMGVALILSLTSFSLHENGVAVLYFARLITYFLFLVYLLHAGTKIKAIKEFTRNGLTVSAIVIIPLSLLQYFLYPDLRNLFYLGWDPHLYRIFGLFFDTFLASAIYGLMAIFLIFSKKDIPIHPFVKWLLAGVFFVFMAFTYSRSLYIAVLATVIFFFARKHLAPVLLFIIIAAVFVVALPKPFGEGVNLMRTYSIASRAEDYRTALQLWMEKPLLGYGYNHIRALKEEEGIVTVTTGEDLSHSGASFHSSFLIILVTSGVAGLFAFFMILGILAKTSVAAGVMVFFLGILSLTDNVLLHPFVLFILCTSVVYFFSRPSDRLQ